MRVASRGLLLLVSMLLLWAVGGHAFYRVDKAHDERAFDLLAELIAHKRELAEATPGPRVVIAGGSNAYYGIDSQFLQERLRMPVVNLALPFGAYDHHINLRLLEPAVQRGDIVVYAEAGFWNAAPDMQRQARGFDSYLVRHGVPGYSRQFDELALPWQPRPQTNTLLLAVLEGEPAKGRSWVDDTDDRGDYTGCVPTPVLLPQRYGSAPPAAALAADVQAGAARVSAKGARFLVALPWLLIHQRDRERWLSFQSQFARQYAPDIPVITAAPETLLRSDRKDFCDSPLHLSIDATRLRSAHLATALRPYLAVSQQGSSRSHDWE